MSVKPRLRDQLCVAELDGEAVIYDEGRGELHHLNPSATIVWSLCDGETSVHAIASTIADAFGMPVDEISTQVADVLGTFRASGLLADHVPGADA